MCCGRAAAGTCALSIVCSLVCLPAQILICVKKYILIRVKNKQENKTTKVKKYSKFETKF